MKLNKIFLSMAALVFVGAMTAGCSSDDLTAETPQLPDTTNGTVVTKVTVSLDEHASTRALTEAGVKTFEAGDKIAVIYKNKAGVTVKAESDPLQATNLHDAKKTASFSVTLTNPKASTPVRYIYPASMAADDVSATTPDNDATIKWTNLATQDGQLVTLGSNLDLAVFDGTMTAQGNLPEPAPLENQLTVGAFTIKNSGGTDITNTITKLTIADGTNTYTVSRTAADGPIYVAMKPVDNKTVTVSVTSNNNKYSDKSVSVTELAKNKIYPINVSLTARYPLAVTSTSVSSEDLGSVIGADGNIYLNAAAAAAASPATTAVAMITYVGSATGETSFTYGLALALSDANDGYFYWKTEQSDAGHTKQTDRDIFTSESGLQYNDATHNTDTYPAFKAAMANNGTTKPTNCSDWFLPTAYQWNQMIDACKNVLGTKNSYEDLRDGFNGVGETNMVGEYWSSTEDGTNTAWSYRFNLGYWASQPKTFTAKSVQPSLFRARRIATDQGTVLRSTVLG